MPPAASINWMNQKQDALNAAIQSATADSRVDDFVTYVSPKSGATNVFAGGDICAAPESRLVNAIDNQTLNELIANAQGPYSYSSLHAALQSIASTPYHPNVVGYQVWANHVHDQLQ
jgi:hypothetical protein